MQISLGLGGEKGELDVSASELRRMKRVLVKHRTDCATLGLSGDPLAPSFDKRCTLRI